MMQEKPCLLVVDDNVDDIDFYRRFLGKDYHVYDASTEEEGFQVLSVEKIDCVLLDYFLPGENGLNILKKWKKLDIACAFVILTGQGNENIAVESLKNGASDYIVKNQVTKERLKQTIANAIDKIKLQRDLKQVQEQLVHRERIAALGEMACGIAHDFNNALSPVKGLLGLLLDISPDYLKDPEKVRNYLELIRKSVIDAEEIVQRLNSFYRKKQENHVPVELSTIVREVKMLTSPKWKDQALKQGKTIHFNSVLNNAMILANESEIRELLINFIFNAVDAIKTNGTIKISCYDVKEKVYLEIEDDGEGMSKETVARCFEPFFTTKDSHGSGLGLSVVYGIIQRHNATIQVESTLTKGTRFRICFSQEKSTKEEKENSVFMHNPPASYNVLVVDDQEINQYLLRELLEKLGYTVYTASDGQIGLQVLSSNIDLVITDFSMPHMNGDTFAKQVKDRFPHIYIILLTGYDEDPSINMESFDGILKKPIDPIRLFDSIASILPTSKK